MRCNDCVRVSQPALLLVNGKVYATFWGRP
jgi:hypothetical protein